MGNECLN
jgi:hypothetical protein